MATLRPGTALWRVHSSAFGPLEFNPNDPDAIEAGGGGRFDAVGGTPAYLYAATTRRAAIAEVLLRDVPFDARGARELPAAALRGRSISELAILEPIRVVALHGEGLSRVGQDTWYRVPAGALAVVSSIPLESGEGLALARASLLAFGVAPPRRV